MGGDRTAGGKKQTWADARSALLNLSPDGLRCLSLLTDLPLIAVAPLSRLLGMKAASAHALLHRLVTSGLVTGVRVALAERSAPRLYHLSDLGLAVVALDRHTDSRSLAVRKRLARGRLLAALPGAALLGADYELLGGVAGSRPGSVELLGYDRPWRDRYARRGSRSPAYIQWGALAHLRWGERDGGPGQEGEYLLLADTGSLPLRGYRARVRQLLEYRVHSRGELPPVLIATTTEERTTAWRSLLAEESQWAHLAPLPARVLTRDEVRQGELSCSLSTATPQPPSPKITTPLTVSILDTSPIPVLVGGLAETAPERLPLPARLGALVRGIAPSDRALVELVGKHPFLTTTQLAVVTGRPRPRVRAACAALERLGLLRRLGDGEVVGVGLMDTHWECAPQGLELAARGAGLSLREAVGLLGLSGGGPDHPVGSRRLLLRAFRHTLGVDGAFVGLYQTAAEFAQRGYDHEVEEWRSAAACAQGRVRPDGYGIYRCGEERYGYYMEWDRGTMGRASYIRKFRAYLELRESGRYERDLAGFPTILVVTEDPSSEARIDGAVRAACAGACRLPVLLTTGGRVEADPDGLLGEIWRQPREGERRYWLRGKSSLADIRGARRPRAERKGFRSPYGYFSHRYE